VLLQRQTSLGSSVAGLTLSILNSAAPPHVSPSWGIRRARPPEWGVRCGISLSHAIGDFRTGGIVDGAKGLSS